MQTHACADSAKLVLNNPAAITVVITRLQRATVVETKSGLAELQTRLGWNIVPKGVMFDERARMLREPTARALYDYTHVLFVSGVFKIHCGSMFKALKPHGVTSAALHEYLGMWTRGLQH